MAAQFHRASSWIDWGTSESPRQDLPLSADGVGGAPSPTHWFDFLMVSTTSCAGSVGGELSRAIRVAYCIDSFDIGGTELNAVRTVEALDRRRFQVTVFHLHETGPLRPRYEALGLQLLHLPIGPLY